MDRSCSHTGEVLLDNVRVPVENRLGEEGSGFKLAMTMLDRSRPMVAAIALGIGRAAYEYARDYAKERVQFGRPIAANQAIQFLLADMATKVQAARLMTWWSARVTETARPYLYESSMAKNFALDVAMEVTTDAVQIFGGYGYIREYPVEKLFRDAKSDDDCGKSSSPTGGAKNVKRYFGVSCRLPFGRTITNTASCRNRLRLSA